MSELGKAVFALLSGGAFLGAVFTFIQFWVTRNDNKKNMEKLLKGEIGEVKKEVGKLSGDFQEYKATLARTHILRFSDDLRNGVHHSEEYFKQQLLDIDTYNRYCETHPEFENGLTVMASEYIYEAYRKQYLNVGN